MCHHWVKSLSLGRSLPDGMFQFAEFSFLVILNVLVLSQDPVYDDGEDTDPLLLQPAELVEDGVAQLDQFPSGGSLGEDGLRAGLDGMILQRLFSNDLLHVGVFDGGQEVLRCGHFFSDVSQFQFLEQTQYLWFGQGHNGQLSKATVGLVGHQNFVIRNFLVVDIEQPPVLQTVNGIINTR